MNKLSPSLFSTPQFPEKEDNMSRSGSRRVIFSPDISVTPTVLLRSGTANRVEHPGYQKRAPARGFTSRLCRKAGYLPVRLFRYVGASLVRPPCFVSCGRSSSSKVSPRTSSRRFAPGPDFHHAEAIEDCIQFINSSSRMCTCQHPLPITKE